MDIRLWLLIKNFMKVFFEKSGQVVITSYNALEHVTKCYNGFRTLVTKCQVVQIF